MAVAHVGLDHDLIEGLENCTDLAAWINGRLEDETEDLTDLAEIDRRVSHLATSLEISYQDIANEVEQTLDTTTRTIPRVTFDLQFMRESTLNLQSVLQKSKLPQSLSANSTDDSVDQILDRLRQLDLIQRNMLAARQILQETESWNTLEAEVSNYIHINDILSFQKAANRLNEAEKSLSLFQDTAEYEPRKLLLTSLENQLEASLSASLVAAANSTNVISCRDYHQIFGQIRREIEFRTYYNGARRADVVSLWNDTKIRDCGESIPDDVDGSEDFVTFFRRFLTSLESLIAEEKNLQPSIFADPVESVTLFFQSLFDALSPSLAQRLEQFSATRGTTGLVPLIEAYQTAQQFVFSMSTIMEKLALHSSFSTETSTGNGDQPPPNLAKQRRASKRMSMSRRSISNLTLATPFPSRGITWEAAILEPFLDYQSEYTQLETAYLMRSLPEKSESRSAKSPLIREREFREQSLDVFSAAEGSIVRCASFTSGYGAVGLVEANENLLTNFIRLAERTLTADPSLGARAVLSPGASQLEDFDYTDQDWTKIQACLRLLDATKGVFIRAQGLDSKLVDFAVRTHKDLQGSRKSGMRSADSIRPDLQLLSQSVLNSIDLQDLFESVDTSFKDRSPRIRLRLLKKANHAIMSLVKRLQSMLCRTILSPLESHLNAYAALDVWTFGPRKMAAESELRMPSFSISPTATIQRVAEGLLNLPRLFEAHVDDESLAFYIELLPFVSSEAETADGSIQGEMDEGLSPDQVTATWLSSLAVTLLDRLAVEILPRMPTLSNQGAVQLAADLDYLSNIVQALNVEWRELELWKEFMHMGQDAASSFVAPDDKADEIFSQVASLRGWAKSVS